MQIRQLKAIKFNKIRVLTCALPQACEAGMRAQRLVELREQWKVIEKPHRSGKDRR